MAIRILVFLTVIAAIPVLADPLRPKLRPDALPAPQAIKPSRETITTGCRPGDIPATAEDFWRLVDAVAHVRVVERRPEERLLPQGDKIVITRHPVDVLAVFKSHPRWPAVEGRGEVRQYGGELDRGDYIDVVRHLCLDPLIVGREYLLFLEESDYLGGWSVFFDEQGAFLIDGRRLDPLGAGEFAQAWQSQPAADLFATLAKLQR